MVDELRLWIDPGHGPGDGCRSEDFFEHQWAFKLADAVAKEIWGAQGIIPRLSRHAEEDPGLTTRAARAKVWEASVALLLHFDIDQADGVPCHGPSLYHYGPQPLWLPCLWTPPEQVARRDPHKLVQAFDTTVPAIWWGSNAANCLRPYHALDIPAVLLEVGYLNDPALQATLSAPAAFDHLVDTIVNWMKRVDQKRAGVLDEA